MLRGSNESYSDLANALDVSVKSTSENIVISCFD
jgi:hypothetical protein